MRYLLQLAIVRIPQEGGRSGLGTGGMSAVYTGLEADKRTFNWWHPFFSCFEPPTELSISQWADKHRRISFDFASESGQWDTSKAEYLRAVMDACSPNDPCTKVVLCKAVQAGGTEAIVINTVLFTIDVAPRSMLLCFPTLDLGDGFSRERLEPAIRLIPSLRKRVAECGHKLKTATGEGSSSTVLRKRFPGGYLNIVGGNSVTGLSSRPIPLVVMDEVDKVLANSTREGSPVQLLSIRTSNFPDKKEIYLSSPGNPQGASGICSMYEDSTQEEWESCCPDCGEWQVLEWERMNPENAKVSCSGCGKEFSQWEWNASQNGRWATRNPSHPSTRGFRVNGLASPWTKWNELVMEWIEARRVLNLGDDSLLRVFINARLARNHEASGQRVEIDLYNERREYYVCNDTRVELPDDVLVITCGVDVADSAINYEIVGWGKGRESWGLEYAVLYGSPRESTVWEKLDQFVLKRIFHWADGEKTRVKLIFVDSGHATSNVYEYTKTRYPRAMAIKGMGGLNHGIIASAKRREAVSNAWVIRVGSDASKEDLFAKLSIKKPGPGYCHFPAMKNGMRADGYDRNYFDELRAEKRVLKYSKGFARYEWWKNRVDANEAMDCRCYARAALEYLRINLDSGGRDVLSRRVLEEMKIEKHEVGMGQTISIDARKPKPKAVGRKIYGASAATHQSPAAMMQPMTREQMEVRQRVRSRWGPNEIHRFRSSLYDLGS
jgi:phage terminase large subunit GpA-like protein